VRQRFGGPACRIFRLLLLKGQLEQKQIAEMAMIPVKDTRELLYRLLKVDFVQLQEVARTADHAPARTFYLWRVGHLHVIDRLHNELHRTVTKVRARLTHMVTQDNDVLKRVTMSGPVSDGASGVSLTREQRERAERLRAATNVLEACLLRLDQLQLLCAC